MELFLGMTALSVPATKFHDLTVIIGGKYRSMMIKVKLTQKNMLR